VKTPGSQMGSPTAAEGAEEAMGGESGDRSEVQARSTSTSTAPKARLASKLSSCSFFRSHTFYF